MCQGFGKRAHCTAVLRTLDHQHGDFFQSGGNGLLDAAMTGIDDIAVATVHFRRDHRWLHDADGTDRRQQQRVSLARALVRPADLWLLDEPMSQLEPQLRAVLRGRIKEYLIEHRMTSVFVTHDQTEAVALSDRIAVMSDGVIQQVADGKTVYDNPDTPFVASFVLGG